MDREDKRLVAGAPSMLFWVAIVIASSILLIAQDSAEGYEVFRGVGLAVGGAIMASWLRVFWEKSQALLASGESLKPFDYRSQFRQGTYLILAIILFFFLPFVLAGLLDTYSWIGSIAGGVDGWLLSLVAYNFYLSRWERVHQGRLYSSKVWRGTKVAQTGIRFAKEGSI